jgi:hypothetical protein
MACFDSFWTEGSTGAKWASLRAPFEQLRAIAYLEFEDVEGAGWFVTVRSGLGNEGSDWGHRS